MYRIAICTGLLLAGTSHSALIYNESFDYGSTTDSLTNVSSWSSSSTFNQYDHDGGLNVATMSGETGGAWFAQRPGGNLSASLSTSTITLSDLSAGDEIWAAALVGFTAGGSTNHVVTFSGGSVSALGFQISSGGDVSLYAANGASASIYNATGVTGTTTGTYLLLLRATKGTGAGTSDPSNSVVDFWFNPSDTSSVGALGGTTYSTGSDSKWGRNSQTMSGITGSVSDGGWTDEIRLGSSFSEVITTVPEPSTALLGSLGLLALLRRRR